MASNLDTSWDRFRKLHLKRVGVPTFSSTEIEQGVNYFVLQLERIGAVPLASCEGHPRGFYIMFIADFTIARHVASAGFFNISLFEGPNHQTIDKAVLASETRFILELRHAETIRDRNYALRLACEAWDRKFGTLDEEFCRNHLGSPHPRRVFPPAP